VKHTVATCAHLLTVAQWRLVDAARGTGSAARGTRRGGHAARDGFGAIARGAGARNARRVHPVRTDGRPDKSITDMSTPPWPTCYLHESQSLFSPPH
jgi:hypothetical protein